MDKQIKSFTSSYPGLSNVLANNVTVINCFDKSKKISVLAVWDTGATNSCINDNLATKLGLVPISRAPVSNTTGINIANVYAVDIVLPNNVTINNLRVTGTNMTSCEMLIGMDVIKTGDFAVSNYQGKTVFSFRIPSMATTDYVRNTHNVQAITKKIGRNDPCPCGSGKKYKQCCGK